MKKNWKTTAAGVLAGLLMLIGNAMNARATDPSAPPITAGSLAPAVAVAVLGALAKDHNVTGS